MNTSRIVISERTTPERLVSLLAARDGAPTVLTGKGRRARARIQGVFNHFPDIRMDVFTNERQSPNDPEGRDWVAIVNPESHLDWDVPGGRYYPPLRPVAWRRDNPSTAPVRKISGAKALLAALRESEARRREIHVSREESTSDDQA